MIVYRDAKADDGEKLAAMAKAAFTETFGHLYPAADLNAFLDEAFGPEGLPAQIGDPAFTILVATEHDAIIGFAKLGPVGFPGEWPEDAVELYQLYVLSSHLGAGIGPALMDWAIATARAGGASQLILSVYVDNHRAKAFYARYGFVDVGRYDFPVGDTIDEDRIMRLSL
ncbi:GNAT family N-acetyltransferase [uncultured Sphingomonas sp.]|uniref:GNAT family N-acetyltransferase n=1 Tax=uncultured Sphingomonas sp. TaxID=158754 RepID=UPI0025F24035|nr:GNAT family N-acetyltransferase [uncultured Sphingomonas sp.]